MWTTENRPRYNRDKLRYPSDLTDEEWAHVEQLIPPAKRGGRRREVDVREVRQRHHVCAEHRVPVALRPQGPAAEKHDLHDYLPRWDDDGTLGKIHHALYLKCREQVEREASPTACIIDSQSVKSAEKGGPASIPKGMMRARRSAARSDISWSTPRACCCMRWFIRPTFRIATAACW